MEECGSPLGWRSLERPACAAVEVGAHRPRAALDRPLERHGSVDGAYHRPVQVAGDHLAHRFEPEVEPPVERVVVYAAPEVALNDVANLAHDHGSSSLPCATAPARRLAEPAAPGVWLRCQGWSKKGRGDRTQLIRLLRVAPK